MIAQIVVVGRITTVIAALIVVRMGVVTFVKVIIVAGNLEKLAAAVKDQKVQMKYSHFIVVIAMGQSCCCWIEAIIENVAVANWNYCWGRLVEIVYYGFHSRLNLWVCSSASLSFSLEIATVKGGKARKTRLKEEEDK